MVNLASRLEGKAPAGGLLVERFTIEDAGDGFVDSVDGGLQSVKGFERPIGVYYVQRFSEDYEMDEMRRFLVEDFLQDELIQETLLPTRNNEETRKMLRDFVVQSLDQSPTLPINPAVGGGPHHPFVAAHVGSFLGPARSLYCRSRFRLSARRFSIFCFRS